MSSVSPGAGADDALHVGEAVDLLAVDGDDEVAGLKPAACGGARRLHRIDARAGGLLAVDREDRRRR